MANKPTPKKATPKLYTFEELAKLKGVPVDQIKNYFKDNSRIGETFSMKLNDPFNWSNPFAGDDDMYMSRIPGNNYTYAGNGKVYAGNVKIVPRTQPNAMAGPTNNFSRSATVNTPTGKATFTSEADLVKQMERENRMTGAPDSKGVFTLKGVDINTTRPKAVVASRPTPTLNTSASIVDYLKSQKQASDFASRAKLANQYNIDNYTGTPEQNMMLLSIMRGGQQSGPPQSVTGPAPMPSQGGTAFDLNPRMDMSGMDAMQQSTGNFSRSASGATPTGSYNFTSEEDLIKQMQAEQQVPQFPGGGMIGGFGPVVSEYPTEWKASEGMEVNDDYEEEEYENEYEEEGDDEQMPMDVAVARFKAAGKEKGLRGGELAAYVEKMKSKYKYQKGGAVKEEDADSLYLVEYAGGGRIQYRGHSFPGYNKPIQAPPGDKHKKMVLVKRGDKIRLVKYGLRGMQDYTQHKDPKRRKNYLARSGGIRNKAGQLTKNDPFSANHWARKDLW